VGDGRRADGRRFDDLAAARRALVVGLDVDHAPDVDLLALLVDPLGAAVAADPPRRVPVLEEQNGRCEQRKEQR
jgi:hypothetical protein